MPRYRATGTHTYTHTHDTHIGGISVDGNDQRRMGGSISVIIDGCSGSSVEMNPEDGRIFEMVWPCGERDTRRGRRARSQPRVWLGDGWTGYDGGGCMYVLSTPGRSVVHRHSCCSVRCKFRPIPWPGSSLLWADGALQTTMARAEPEAVSPPPREHLPSPRCAGSTHTIEGAESNR